MLYNAADTTLTAHTQASSKLAQINQLLKEVPSSLHLTKTVPLLGKPREKTGFTSQPTP